MKFLIPVLSLVALSGAAFAQTQPVPAPATAAVPTTPIFKDVPPTHWAFAAVQRLAAAGIIEGYPSTAEPTMQVVAKVAPAKPAKVTPKAVAKTSPKVAPKKPIQR
ncbi:hypothetical protein IAD21_02968 [Abditibacteriota bacterium]|nr:hypothetical protein IAD21_02968 [Abditibacteriota bacterium]